MIKIVIRLILLLALPLLANAQTVQLLGVRVGETVLHIPSPSEFHEIGQLSVRAKKYWSIVMSSIEHDLLGVFVPKDEVSDILKNNSVLGSGTFAILSVKQGFKDMTVPSVADFQWYKELWKSVPYPSNSETQLLMEDMVSNLNPVYQGKFDIVVDGTETTPLGIFVDDDNAIGFIGLQKMAMERTSTGKRKTMIVVESQVDVLVKGKILTVGVSAPYDTHDVEWVRSISKEWVRQILSHNE